MKMNEISKQLARRLNELRKVQGLTLDQLASLTGLTKSYLSKIENGKKVPPLGSLTRICHALGVDLAALFGGSEGLETEDPKVCVVRAAERLPTIRGGTTFGYDYENLAHRRIHKHMEPFLFTFPSSVSEEVFFEHDGEEFIFVTAGRVRFLVDGQEWVLNPGDSVYFDASLPHRGEAVGGEAKALVIIYTPPGKESGEPKGRAGGTTFVKTLRQRETELSAVRRNEPQ
jgi:transcriptional regulator with XRE-family HTH domain